MNYTIKAENISKQYFLMHKNKSDYTTLKNAISDFCKNLFSKNQYSTQEKFLALQDINFKIKQGERVAFLGNNGAGKSTLLKLLSRITEPTTGKIIIYGKVSSLLEVGTGFHPELTGRENIFFNGAILGMSKSEIKKQFDEIVHFSELEKFLDLPIKRYSSGMSIRLAFSIGVHLRSDVMILDEVLSVGDKNFQKKSIAKIKRIAMQSGRTILFVSHNLEQISELCDKGFLLQKGKIIMEDQIHKVIKKYNHLT